MSDKADEKIDESRHGHPAVQVHTYDIDEAAQLAMSSKTPLDPAEANRVRKKIDRHILPLMVQFMDKTTLGSSAILGIREATHLNANHNWLGTVFYISYLIFEYPQNLALQRFRVGKWMSLNIFIWSIVLAAHAACTNFGGLFAVRFVLGMCEGSITAGFLIVTSMFYTHKEQSVRVGYWFLMNGTAQIISGFLSFGVLHIHSGKFEPWQWLMVLTGAITFITALLYAFFFPDSPTTAWFLTPEERVIAIQRIRVNQSGTENKHFKVEQVWEAVLDPKTWLFALFNIPNSLTNQRSIIVSSFGFSTLQTTLLGIVDGSVEIITIFTGVKLVERFPNSRAIVGAVYFIPNIIGSILVNTLPFSNRIGLLFSYWTTGVGTTGFVLSLGWINAVTAGHTKRITTNAIMLCAYCTGNIIGPQIWQQQFKPRNRVPWIIISVCYLICPFILLAIRRLLKNENTRRDTESRDDSYDETYVEQKLDDGTTVEIKVDRAFLDLTDRQNREFRYVL
ncbi:MFS general substrate transporter [Sistotremastrum suecicum HHB10207 ss-3]|uniref:MFS general substrate transporter n=1 Tax=Sistotremastrum suecicum HHB10207 ss-3 TaxID=1314776 RepID=A0A166EL00_9AGAM|nr:MFS general substrate transporter [Sistotremastrum suecicum HHB10207 ss-3]